MTRRLSPAVVRGSESLIRDSDAYYRANTVPALGLVGDQDAFVESARRLATLMPQFTVVEIPGATHDTAVMHLLFVEELLAFLARQTAR